MDEFTKDVSDSVDTKGETQLVCDECIRDEQSLRYKWIGVIMGIPYELLSTSFYLEFFNGNEESIWTAGVSKKGGAYGFPSINCDETELDDAALSVYNDLMSNEDIQTAPEDLTE